MSTTQRTARFRCGNAAPSFPASSVVTTNGKPGSTKLPTLSSWAVASPVRQSAATAPTARAAPQRAPLTVRRMLPITRSSPAHHRNDLRRAPWLPTLTVLAREPAIRLGHVGHLHLRAVVEDLLRLAGAQRDDAEEHRLGELRRVVEGRAGLSFALARVGPIGLVRRRHALEGLRHLLRLGGERLGVDLRVVAVRLVRHEALVADEDATAAFTRERDVLRQDGEEPAVVPDEAHGGLITARGELVARQHRERIGAGILLPTAPRRARRDDRRRIVEPERPERLVDDVRAHVADRAHAEVDEAAPAEWVVRRVIGDLPRGGTEEQIPVHALRDRLRIDLHSAQHGVVERAHEKPWRHARIGRRGRSRYRGARARDALCPEARGPV